MAQHDRREPPGLDPTGVALPDAVLAALRATDSADQVLDLLRDSANGSEPAMARNRFPELVAAAVESLEPGAATAGLLETLSPADRVSGRARLRMIAGLDRQIARLQAQQASWIASFARPGIAAGYGELIDLALHGHTSRLGAEELISLIPLDLQDDPEACARILARHPEWEFELAELAAKTAAHEIGAVMGISPRSADNRVRDARRLVNDYPSSLEAMLTGRIDRLKASILADELDFVDPDLRVELEQEALSEASRFTAGRFGKRLRQLAITIDPAAADRRAEQARASRKVRVNPGEDDSARFTADLPADQALLAWAVLNHTADRLPDEFRNGRSLDQLRADIFAGIFSDLAEYGRADLRHPDLLPAILRPADSAAHQADNGAPPEPGGDTGGGSGTGSGTGSGSGTDTDTDTSKGNDPGAGTTAANDPGEGSDSGEGGTDAPEPWSPCQSATVIIAASTLAGLDDDPAKLAGHGWITAGYGRALAASASSIRIAVHHDIPAPDPPPQPCGCAPRHHSAPPDCCAPPGGAAPPDSASPPSATAPPADTSSGRRAAVCDDPVAPDNTAPSDDPTPPDNTAPSHDPTPPDNTAPSHDPTPPDNTAPSDDPAPPGDPASVATEPTPAANPDHRQPCYGEPGHQGCSINGRASGSIDRACGSDLDHGRAVYRPPVAVADHVVGRDQTCRFPGCTRAAEACDLDHRQAYGSGGATCPCNLDALCRPHHRPKTFLDWRAIRLPANHLRWTSPHGYQVVDHPESQPMGMLFTKADLDASETVLPARLNHRSPADDPPPF